MRRAQEAINEVRALVNDQDATLVSNDQLLKWLWEGANHLVLEGQLLKYPYQLLTKCDAFGNGQQEYPLPFDEGDIVSVKHNTGTLVRDLVEVPAETVQLGSYSASALPRTFYKKLNAAILGPLVNPGMLVSVQANPGDPQDYKYVIGFDPPANTAGQTITIQMNIPHPPLRNVRSRILLPFSFQYGAVAWAAFKVYTKEKSYMEAQRLQSDFTDIMDKCKERALSEGRAGHGSVKRNFVDDDGFYGHRVIPTDTGMIGT